MRFPTAAVLAFALIALAAPVSAPRAQDLGEITLRLDRLEAENRRLTGQLEQAQNLARRLEDQLKRFQQDVELRFQDQAGARPVAPRPPVQASAPPAANPAAPPRPRREDSFDPNALPAAPGAPRQLGSSPPSGPLPAPLPAAPPAAGTLPPVAGTPAPGAPANALEAYNQARATLQRGEYEAAEQQLRDFLKAYPRDARAGAATFQLGETFFRRNRHREAAEQYLEVSTKYQRSQVAPESLLKLSMSLRALGEKDQACGTLAEVGRRYPQANDNLKRAVEREQARAQC